jgi:acetyl esterase/lipase
MTRRIVNWLAVIAVAAMAMQTAADAQGQRYRDEVFASATVTSNIAYGQAPDEHGAVETLRLDVYQPTGDTAPARPAFIWIHGGGFSSGDKADDIEELVGREFARRGYVVASITYRMREGEFFSFAAGDPRLPEVIADAQHDAQAAVRWLRANASAYRVDTARVAVGGFSAGAVAALSACYHSDDPGESGSPGYPSTVSACVAISGNMDVSLMEAGEPATLVVHGTEDTWVPYQGALDIVDRAEEVGVTTEFRPIEGAGHVVWFDDTEPIIDWMSDFLYRYVAPASASGSSSGVDAREVAILATLCVAGLLLVAAAWRVYSVRRR